MEQPIGLVIPWLVFAGGVGFEVWKLTRLIHRQVRGSLWEMERFREELERTWQRSWSASRCSNEHAEARGRQLPIVPQTAAKTWLSSTATESDGDVIIY